MSALIDTDPYDLERVPLRIFVVWNPAFEDGVVLARELYQWFGGPNRTWHRSGLGIPVMFWTTEQPDEVPPPVPTETQNFTVIVPLVDDNFAGRLQWRQWLEKCDTSKCQIRFWGIHSAAFKIEKLSPINPLGTGDCKGVQLKRVLTVSCAMLLIGSRIDSQRSPLNFFISYARKDGSSIAHDVRRALLDYGNVQVFMDVHDIEPGSGWKIRLDDGIERGAAMLAIVTDEYSSRAWCRRELREFRTPVRDKKTNPNHWWLRPVFVLDALSGNRTRSMFEIGSAPAARWKKNEASAIIDMLVRDILFGEVQRRHSSLAPCRDAAHVINWVPDTWTLLELQRFQESKRIKEVIYPGDGLPDVEKDRLREVFPAINLFTFEEAEEARLR